MIPQNNVDILIDDQNNNTTPTKDFFINFELGEIQNIIDGLDAIKQTIYMILHTQKGAYTIYPLDYGTDLDQYIGTDLDFIKADLPNEVKNSLKRDKRILDVYNFNFENNEKESTLYITFNISTIYGLLSEGLKIDI